ncbi:MAG: photosystem II stability/assembly factor-like uncharacterized protein [Paraglaciecola sp.]|jgi:photosystem II stability/assembly factor-like uncharacterized protein
MEYFQFRLSLDVITHFYPNMKKIFLSTLTVLLVLSLFAQSADQYLQPLKYRNIGPVRGGRSNTASGVLGDPLTYYMGTTGGGVWKTTDAGQRWNNVSDGFFETGSVGAVSVSPSDPNTIYVGMGEHAVRGVQTNYGDGVYKSVDAGATWLKVGLEKTQHISRIVVNPTNPDIVYVSAQGALFAPNPDRGIYKSKDGGKNWRKVLFVNDSTGGVELSMDANYPNILYAAMWQYQRTPWKVISGGEGSGLYKSVDGGETWKPIHKGLPEEKGKMAIAVSPANSNKVYALIESDSDKDLGGLFVSNNAGESWSLVSGDNRLTQRAWYYIEVFADPQDEHTLYVLSAPALRSIDGGKSWERITGTHGDYHDLWINPDRPTNMVIANDGGAAITFDRGATWSRQDNMPTSEFYRVNADDLFPYNVYGGQQDNSSVKIASMAHGQRGISERNWSSSAGGESAFLAFDPANPTKVMGGSYLGTIQLLDVASQTGTGIMAAPIQYLGRAARDMKYLYNWNAPIIRSMHEENTYFHCAQLVLRTRDEGKTWEEVSPDLTRNMDDKQGEGGGPYTVEAVGAENYGTIAYMIESPHEKGVYWTGSDDGFVHVTRDNGETWVNVTPKGLQECLINAIDVSPHDPGTAYIATTRYKFNDYTPAVYKTTNYGKSWTNISTGIPYGAFTRVVREDADRKDLLYAGTEKGMYISWNGGKQWESFQLNLPVTAITDLKVHQGDLLVATSGRSFWILDDLAILSQYGTMGSAKLYKPEAAVYGFWGSPLNGNSTDGTDLFNGLNPANGVVMYYELPEMAEDAEIKMVVKDAAGQTVNSYTSKADPDFQNYAGGPSPEPVLSTDKGLNRFVWNMNYTTMPGIPTAYLEAGFSGHRAAPGSYSVELTVGTETLTTAVGIQKNPLYDVTDEQYQEYHALMMEMEGTLTSMHTMVNQLYKLQLQVIEIIEGLDPAKAEAVVSGKTLLEEMTAWDEDMIQRKSTAYDDVENFPNKFTAEYIFLINASNSPIPQINQSSLDRKAELEKQWVPLKAKAEALLNESVPAFNQLLWEAGIGAVQMKN